MNNTTVYDSSWHTGNGNTTVLNVRDGGVVYFYVSGDSCKHDVDVIKARDHNARMFEILLYFFIYLDMQNMDNYLG
ncbi:hypothetical protein BT96DRAFT_929002 [Gymnopus androsaceus JB14]|uniref:Uncharacterized protein n=1 Tax=Gymnopus androsaceus JB14 TaxID=1447944 RepID=A0A6A4GHV3_9AGAR|nr:hypothetical protein BT96DRAFT_929002 [Gymnopus androsaceus JB14]